MGQLKKFEIKIYGTNDVPEEQIDIPEVKRNQAEPNKEPTNNWPGVNPKLELPFPKYQYIGKLSHFRTRKDKESQRDIKNLMHHTSVH